MEEGRLREWTLGFQEGGINEKKIGPSNSGTSETAKISRLLLGRYLAKEMLDKSGSKKKGGSLEGLLREKGKGRQKPVSHEGTSSGGGYRPPEGLLVGNEFYKGGDRG